MGAKEKLWTVPYLLVLVAGTFTSLSFFMVTPIITKYAVGIGASLAVAGVIAGLFSITALVVRPVSGIFADKFNRKKLLLVSTGAILASVLLYSAAGSLPLLTAARIMHGAAFAFSGTVSVAIVASIVPRSRLGEGIGYQGMGHILATALAPNLGIVLGDSYGFRFVFLVSAGLLAVALSVMAFYPNLPAQRGEEGSVAGGGGGEVGGEGDAPKTRSKKFSLGSLISFKILPLAIIGGFFSFLNGTISSFLVLLGDERGIGNIGVFFAVNAVCLIFIRPIAGRVADKKGLSFVLYPCLAFASVAAALLGSAASIIVVVAAAALIAVGQGAGQPSVQAACLRMLPTSMSGLAASTFYIGADIGQGVGPVIGGVITDRWGYGAMFFTCAGLMVCWKT